LNRPEADPRAPRAPTFLEALVPVAFLIAALGYGVGKLGVQPHIPLVLGAVVAGLMGWRLGYRWKTLEEGLVRGITVAIPACLILLVIGILIGTWVVSGIVPAMIYYGLEILAPSAFLLTACVICALVSLATGSSWSTAGTVGVALIGIAGGLGVSLPMAAGAVISGAYLGDKMSPLSDTTNLAPAVAGSEMFDHIRHMVWTTFPAFVLALVIYGGLGLTQSATATSPAEVEVIVGAIDTQFRIGLWLLIPPLLVVVMVALRIPALPALVGGAILGGVFALVFQVTPIEKVIDTAYTGFKSASGNAAVDKLLSRGGLSSMMETVALILCALAFGGLMERTGMLGAIADGILKMARSTGSLVLSTILTCIAMNIVACDQYLSIVIPGRMYRDTYARRGLASVNLSRCLEDAGTLSAPLVPWTTGGAYMTTTLGVATGAYLPFAFLNLLTPVVSVIYGFTGFTMRRANDAGPRGEEPSEQGIGR